jgi:hypothetical protein
MVMIPTEIKDIVRSQIQNVTDLRLLRGETPWSLAGSDGSKRVVYLGRRGELMVRINVAIEPHGWTAALLPVRSEAGRTNKINLVLMSPSGEGEAWSW